MFAVSEKGMVNFMQIRETKLDNKLEYPLDKRYPLHKLLFFDIETTGLSSNMSYLYLIGCIYFKDSEPILLQWFSDGIEEEKQLLHHFFTFLKDFEVILHYNGSGFDLPYLQKKCKRYELPYNFDKLTSIDLYKELTTYKKLLPLTSFKQRSVEEFLNIKREDPFTGGDLISVYTEYVGTKRYERLSSSYAHEDFKVVTESGLPSLAAKKSDALLYTLLLHNAEDLKGLLHICSMLSYVDLFSCNFKDISYEFGNLGLFLRFTLDTSLPTALSLVKQLNIVHPTDSFASTPYEITLMVEQAKLECFLPYYNGELKHFFPNYTDYYYLPVEDTAIHKSVAEYVEKEFRKKATKETSYIKKQGSFLPQLESLFTPEFKQTSKDKLCWYEKDQGIKGIDSMEKLHQDNFLIQYFKQILLIFESK